MNFFEHLEGYTTNKTALVKNIYKLFKLEAKLAGLNILPLLINLGLLITFLLSTWLIAMALLGYLILPLCNNNPLIVVSILFFLNIVLVMLIGKNLAKCLSRMSFTKTRAVLSENDESLKEAHENANRPTSFDRPVRKRHLPRAKKSS